MSSIIMHAVSNRISNCYCILSHNGRNIRLLCFDQIEPEKWLNEMEIKVLCVVFSELNHLCFRISALNKSMLSNSFNDVILQKC